MKIKTLLSLFIAFLALSFIACDDDLNSVGSNMQPKDDEIFVGVDTVIITAKTVSLNDSVYARTTFGVLGEYTDPVFGKIKSDYMSEFYCPDNTSFHENFIEIDSVKFNIGFDPYSFTGDSINPMGLAIYEVNKNLDKNYFTNIDASDYCDMSKTLTKGVFTIKNLPINTNSGYQYREIYLKTANSFGQRFYNEWKNTNGETFKNSDSFRKFFRGIYVTPNFGTGSLINVSYTRLNIYYKYKYGLASDGVSDSIEAKIFTLPVTPEVIQMNRIRNDQSVIKQLTAADANKTYIKSPAGVCTEITIPLKEIIEKSKENTLNSVTFRLKEFVEEEEKSGLNRPTYLLFVNKDSIADYFVNSNTPNFETSFIMQRVTTNNTYNFITAAGGSASTSAANISALINYYIKHYKNSTNIPDLKYLVIPVSASANSSGIYSVYNLMSPTSAIFRTNSENMKMGLIFSKYTEREE